MPSPAQILASLEGAARAVRWTLVGDLGRIRSRRDAQEFFLDFRPYGRVWSNRGIRILDEATARRLLEQIRGQVADGTPLEEVIARYQPPRSKPNLVPTWLQRWAETLRREADAGSPLAALRGRDRTPREARQPLIVLRCDVDQRDHLWPPRELEPLAG